MQGLSLLSYTVKYWHTLTPCTDTLTAPYTALGERLETVIQRLGDALIKAEAALYALVRSPDAVQRAWGGGSAFVSLPRPPSCRVTRSGIAQTWHGGVMLAKGLRGYTLAVLTVRKQKDLGFTWEMVRV